MDIFLLVFLVMVISHSSYAQKHDAKKYLSKETTDSIRGFFTVLVLFRHYGQYINLGKLDEFYRVVDPHVSQAIVVPFLFYSGYGVALSFLKTGSNYIKKILTNRIPRIVLQFELAVVLFLIVGALQGRLFSVKQILFSMLAWDTVGNSNWYVLMIIVEYTIFAISFSFRCGDGKKQILNFISFFSLFYLTILFVAFLKQAGKEFYWYNTALMFPLGVVWAYLKPNFDSLLDKKEIWLGAGILLLMLYVYSLRQRDGNFIWYSIWCATFMGLCLLFSIKVRINSAIISFCAKHVFSIYILQRIPMMTLNRLGWTKTSPYLSFIISIFSTMLLAIIFDKCVKKIERLMSLSYVR